MIDADGLRARGRVLHAVRGFFADRGYIEIQSPVLVPSPAMEEHLFAIRAADGFLRTSPEFALKRAVAAGLPRIYEIGPCLRDREAGGWHGREFTMLEWYRVGASLADLQDEVRAIVTLAAEALGRPVPGPWVRTTCRDLFRAHVGVDLATAAADELAPGTHDGWDEAFFRRWVDTIEGELRGAQFVEGWPASCAALSQVRDDGDWPYAERFEVYIDGIELANAFFELVDSQEQLRRALSVNAARQAAGEDPHPIDREFVAAVGQMPTTAGIAMGLDRLVAVLCGWDGIAKGRF